MSAKKPESLNETPDGGRTPEKHGAKGTLVVGEIIAGKFRVDRILGQGGMGVVVLATHLVLEEQFALKLLRPELAADPEIVERFSREAKACVRIKSEYVARVHDVGMRGDGTPFMVMEYLEGIDLGTALHESGPLPIAEAVEYVVQACEALAQAHAIGIVHRDIKPENLFMVNQMEGWSSIKLLDFGISKAIPAPRSQDFAARNRPGNVRETRMMGTPHYMSPEQMQQLETIDGRSDIWSLGVVLYELLTAHYAWDGATVREVTQAILKGKAPLLEEVRRDAPPGLSHVIERCLEKDPELRYANVAELAIALLPFAPRRARISAERSVSVIRAAGLSRADFKVPTSIHPPSSLASTGPAISSASFPAVISREAPTMPDVSAELAKRAAVEKRTRTLLTVAAGAGIVASGLAIGLLTMQPRPGHDARTPAPSSVGGAALAPATQLLSAAAEAPKAMPAAAVASVEAPVASAASSASAALAASTPATSASGKRRVRPRLNEPPVGAAPADGGEPDLGY
ncbi:protein kinase [Pendulispora brunnea]|uniref:Protein kinase n=1 Tax=Pendulispora brunnea TaxID=2905690 RepID=A0ABZ2KMS0_9BACT